MSKKLVNVEELKRLGFPADLIEEACLAAEKGLLDIEPPRDLPKRTMQQITERIVRCVQKCTGKNLTGAGAWQHFSGCQNCKDLWRADLCNTK